MSSTGAIEVRRAGRRPRARFLPVTSREMSVAMAVGAALGLDVVSSLAAGRGADWLRTMVSENSHNLNVWYFVLVAFWLTAPGLRLYDVTVLRSVRESVSRCIAGLAIAVAVALIGAFALKAGERFSRVETFLFLGTVGGLMAAGRALLAQLLKHESLQLHERIALLGDGKIPSKVPADLAVERSALPWTPSDNTPEFFEGVFRLFSNYDRILLAFADREERLAWAKVFQQTGLAAEVIEPGLAEVIPIGLGKWAGHGTLVISRGPLSLSERCVKRALDIALTLAMAPVVLPLIAILLALVRLDSSGPVLFVQERVGRNNNRYKCYKIRTMHAALGDSAGSRSTERSDPRLTRLGALLRRTSMDELPQLWNVLKGDMSLVGPRPHALGSTAEGALFWEAVPGYWTRHAVKPGMTGLAQVRGFRGATEHKRDLELRIASDMEYINAWSIWLDLRIIAQTACILLFQRAY